MKKLLLLVALCFCASVASAQTIGIVHLKNGECIRGIITERNSNKLLNVQTSDGSTFVYSFNEVEKITKEFSGQESVSAFGNKQDNSYSSSFRPHYESGVDLGYSFGVSSIDGTGRLNVSTTHGCRVIPELYVGAGFGIDYYHNRYLKLFGIPIFADFRGYFTQLDDIKPFLNFRIGYSMDDIKGLYFSPSIGVYYKMLDASLGYTYQQYDLGAITIKVGVRF